MNCYPKRISKQVMNCVRVRLSPGQMLQIDELARRAQTKADSYVQEIIEVFLESRRHPAYEPTPIQRMQVQNDVIHSGLNSDGHCLYAKG